MSFQNPPEIPGVNNRDFLRAIDQARRVARKETPISEEVFEQLLADKLELLEMKSSVLIRNLNEGFSGGEKKRNEMLQMAILDPVIAILDETDSGLDIDALRAVARGILKLLTPEKGLLVITHYQRLLDYLQPHHVHVLKDGLVTMSGGAELVATLESKGYGE